MIVVRLADFVVPGISCDSPARSSRAVCFFNFRNAQQMVPSATKNPIDAPVAQAVPVL